MTFRRARDILLVLGKTKRPVAGTEKLIEAASMAPSLQRMRQRLERGGALSCHGVDPAAHAFFAAVLRYLLPGGSIILVSEGLKIQERLQDELESWLKPDSNLQGKPLFYPAWEVLPHEERLPHADVISERLEILTALLSRREEGGAVLINTTVTALMQKTFSPEVFKESVRTLRRGDKINPLDLVEWCEDQGYDSEAQVTQKGELAMRGGILDIFPLTSPWPARLEFFGDELESLRLFDPITQVSREEISDLNIPPAGEFGLLKKLVQSSKSAALGTLLDFIPTKTIFVLAHPRQLELQAGAYAAQIPANDPFLVDWPAMLGMIKANGAQILSLADIIETNLFSRDAEVPPGSATGSELEISGDAGGGVDPDSVTIEIDDLDVFRPLAARVTEAEVAQEQRRQFFDQLLRWQRQRFSVAVLCNTQGEKERFCEIWEEFRAEEKGPPGDRKRGGLIVEIAAIERGFIFEEAKLVVAADAEIFGRFKVRRPRRLRSPHAAATRSAFDINFSEFEEGDYVVHLQHGIGRYLGLKLLPVTEPKGHLSNGTETERMEEFLAIEYAPHQPDEPAPKLYVPVRQAHLVGKYVGAGKARPPLNTLGSARWGKAKAQAEEAVHDLAGEFLAIQAARASQPGHAFKADQPWQREFESAFPFQETPGQMRAIEDTKHDMEAARPMDRLICGDVGFGKTEVAIRAAFKAALEGKQTAILTPTTILAQQHFNTFRERMADYPIRIELLSRFRSRREQKIVLDGLAAGAVDMVIGTHRLLQGDVAFRDLGLVVIDEEQRFGVAHKEKFKRLRRLVDVLTLSATPIPRTLYMALTGARDLSTIETPPQDRLPVETIVAPYDERIIRDSIQREINRGGQVFYLHNRVFDIESVAARLRSLLPRERIVVGHGQLGADELEEVMTRFVNGEADVLLSTTIIESGLDIPNANTIIIDRADRFGLSDLYQLRGRVGRYKHQAYAYLLLPRHAGLLADARKRISALRQYSTLGSGFKIAMRDLEIRGAGNLLGSEQSGHITAVGFDLYCQLLKQSIAAMKGEKIKLRQEVSIHLDFLALSPAEEAPGTKPLPPAAEPDLTLDLPRETGVVLYLGGEKEAEEGVSATAVERAPAYIPKNYMGEARHRIEVYRKLAQVSHRAELDELRREVEDRFGKIPTTVDLLWHVTELKLLAAEGGISAIENRGDRLMLTRNHEFIMTGGKFPRLEGKTANGRLKDVRDLLMSMTNTAHARDAGSV